MEQSLKEKLVVKDKWLRLVFMLLFAVVNYVIQMVIWFIAAFQFIVTLFVGKPNQNLHAFSHSLCTYSYQIIKFLTYDTEEKPYPFAAWPTHEKK